jgi:hypothetical protein
MKMEFSERNYFTWNFFVYLIEYETQYLWLNICGAISVAQYLWRNICYTYLKRKVRRKNADLIKEKY